MPTISDLPGLARRHPICLLLTELACVSFALFLAGCASSRVDDPTPAHPSTSRSLDGVPTSDVELRLRSEYDRWRGTPHVLGGTTSRGLDCSAFVQRVYADAFNMHLPRTTEDQVRIGRKVSARDLAPGDLVFFRPSKTRHVGIYLSGGEFAHVSSSDGVTISQLDLPYWRNAYWTSRRVLTDRPEELSASRPDVPSREGVGTAPGGRAGW